MPTPQDAEAGAVPAFAVSSLDALNLGKLAAAGVWCALRHPVTGAPLVTPEGAAIRLKLAGMDAPHAKAAAARLAADLASTARSRAVAMPGGTSMH